jgi:hypothetical protein
MCYHSLLKQEKGSTLIIFMFMMAAMLALSVGALQMTSLNLESARALLKGKKSFYTAESGLDQAVATIVTSFENLVPYQPIGGAIALPEYRDHQVEYSITKIQDRYLTQTINGKNIINNYAHEYEIIATSRSTTDNSKETLTEQIRILETPLVQWFIFYGGDGDPGGDPDLELMPGKNWTSWGRIHTNGNFHVATYGNGGTKPYVRFQNFDPDGLIQTPLSITVTGSLLTNKKTGGTATKFAEMKISNTSTVWEDFIELDKTYDSSNLVALEDDFKGFIRVNEQPHKTPGKVLFQRNGFYEGVALNPLIPGVDGITIIGQGSNIKVFVSRPAPGTDVTDQIFNPLLRPYYTGPDDIIQDSPDDFCDWREERRVDTTDIDLYALELWFEDYLAFNGLGALGENGILVYTSRSPDATFVNDADPLQAIRLKKINTYSDSQLLSNTTIATDNPLYIEADFNTVNRKGVAIISDSINILSNAWTTKECNLSAPSANISTSVNAAFFSGNSPSILNGKKGGGVHNYPRLHERWSKPLNYRGAFINLWISSQADGDFCLSGKCYSPPRRNYGWDTNFANPDYWPPYIPSIFTMERLGFLE